MDDLKRYQKLKEVGGKKLLSIERRGVDELKRDIQDINIFNEEALNQEQAKSTLETKTQKKLKIIKKPIQQAVPKMEFKGAWYIPASDWKAKTVQDLPTIPEFTDIPKKSKIGGNISLSLQYQNIISLYPIVLTKQALNFLIKPYQDAGKKLKVSNREDGSLEGE